MMHRIVFTELKQRHISEFIRVHLLEGNKIDIKIENIRMNRGTLISDSSMSGL